MSEAAPGGPPGKTAVVVRAGPDKKRPIIIDAAVGIIGIAFLLGAVALVDVLPEPEVVVPQYKAVFAGDLNSPANTIIDVDTGELVGASGFEKYLAAGEAISWKFDFTADNIYEVRAKINVVDDRAATLPDFFSAYLEAPNGSAYEYPGTNGKFQTARTEPNPSGVPDGTIAPIYYVSNGTGQVSMTFRGFGTLPSDYIFTVEDVYGEPGDFELHEIQKAVRDREYRPNTVGQWSLHVVMESIGHCPTVNALALDVERAMRCQIQNSWETDRDAQTGAPSNPTADPEQDPGNPIVLAEISWIRFEVSVEEA